MGRNAARSIFDLHISVCERRTVSRDAGQRARFFTSNDAAKICIEYCPSSRSDHHHHHQQHKHQHQHHVIFVRGSCGYCHPRGKRIVAACQILTWPAGPSADNRRSAGTQLRPLSFLFGTSRACWQCATLEWGAIRAPDFCYSFFVGWLKLRRAAGKHAFIGL